MNCRKTLMLWLLFTLFSVPAVKVCSPSYGLVHVHWDHQREVQYQLECGTWTYFCQDSGWGDKEATVLCRELGYSHGISGYIPTGAVSGLVKRIACSGHESRLRDCVIEPASANRRPICTSIGTLSACHGTLPKVYLSADREKAPEDDSFHVCVHVSDTLLHNITVFLQTIDGSALADFDYVRVGRQLEFVESATAPVSDCVQIKLLDDNLAESEEWFTIQIYTQWTPENAPDDQLRLQIQPSDRANACSEGSVTVVRDADNSSLQLVEMCSNGVWSPLCDNHWTLQDATIVCRELGYSSTVGILPIDLPMKAGTTVIKEGSNMVPECSGAETRLLECLRKPSDDKDCYPVFVDCSVAFLPKETVVVNETVETTGDEMENDDNSPKDKPSGEDGIKEGDNVGVGLGAVLGMSVVTLSMTVLLVLVSGNIIFCLWYQKKRKRRVIQQICSHSEQRTLHITPNLAHSFVEHSLYTNHHTSPPDGDAEHTYSTIFDSSPHHHEYATLELVPTPTIAAAVPRNSINIYHVLENSTEQRYSDVPNRLRTM